MSIVGCEALQKAPPSVAPKQWRTIFDIGIRTSPAIAITSAASFAYAALKSMIDDLAPSYDSDADDIILASRLPPPIIKTRVNPVYLLSAAAVSVLMIVPWTQLMMLSTNAKLDAKLAESESEKVLALKDDPELESLITKWASLNSVRSVFPALGAVVGLWAALG